jgi:hypothetical protein
MNSLIAILVVLVVFGILGVIADLLSISVDQMLSLSDKDPREHREAIHRGDIFDTSTRNHSASAPAQFYMQPNRRKPRVVTRILRQYLR